MVYRVGECNFVTCRRRGSTLWRLIPSGIFHVYDWTRPSTAATARTPTLRRRPVAPGYLLAPATLAILTATPPSAAAG